MLKKSAPVAAFFLLLAGSALCQNQTSSSDLHQRDNSLQLRNSDVRVRTTLPDAPSVDETRASASFDPLGDTPETPVSQLTLTASDASTNSDTFFDKYLYPSLLKRNLHYVPSSNGSFMSRATDAASRLFLIRDNSGKATLNDSYFFGVLTSVMVQTAQTPFWTRSTSGVFNNFGSTIGSDAGMNVLHEFEPGIWQLVNRHTPRFVSRLEGRIMQNRTPKETFSSPAR